MTGRRVRVGCASGFWGDSVDGARQLLEQGDVDYLVFDYLSEVTMSLLARARAKDAAHGYARDFVHPTMARFLPLIAAQGVKVVANAGGINPETCRDALIEAIGAAGLGLKVAIVLGDDLMPLHDELRKTGVLPFDGAASLPDYIISMNAYLGALPIARAIAAGADIVVTGRCVDSALVLGPLMHEFGWRADDFDRLAAGSLAGHIVECGVQAVGGNFTDWQSVGGWDRMGYPVVEVRDDGSFVVTKPADTGGLVTELTVAEQLLYELGDPASYILPDVICDFTQVTLVQAGPDRVEVKGARGRAPTDRYKVSATYQDGFRSTAIFTMIGRDNYDKIGRVGDAILCRVRQLMAREGHADFKRTSLKIIGAEEAYGANARPAARQSRELVLRLDVHHESAEALKLFAREIAPAGLAMGPGRCSLVGGRPTVAPLVRLFTCYVPKQRVDVRMVLDDQVHEVPIPAGSATAQKAAAAQSGDPPKDADWKAEVPLAFLAVARSGDKGDTANIGVVARQPDYLPFIRAALTPLSVRHYFAHFVEGTVERFELPAMHALNFVLHDALDGGGTASLRNDPLGKGFAQMLLDHPVRVPERLARELKHSESVA